MNDFPTTSKPAIASKGVTGSTGAFVMPLLALILQYQATGEVPAAEAVILIGSAISALIGLWGRVSGQAKISGIF